LIGCYWKALGLSPLEVEIEFEFERLFAVRPPGGLLACFPIVNGLRIRSTSISISTSICRAEVGSSGHSAELLECLVEDGIDPPVAEVEVPPFPFVHGEALRLHDIAQ
jgi:hypothetical protein